MRRTYLLILAALLFVGFAPVTEKADPQKEMALLKAYMAKHHPGKKWQDGPTAINTPAVRAAFGKRRFFAVSSTPPVPPGANIPELIDRFKKSADDFAKNYINLLIVLEEDGTVTPIKELADFNRGLMKVANDEDARTAAAAVLALESDGRTARLAVNAAEIKLNPTKTGWHCVYQKPNVVVATVIIDASGKVTSITKQIMIPLVPSARPPSGPTTLQLPK